MGPSNSSYNTFEEKGYDQFPFTNNQQPTKPFDELDTQKHSFSHPFFFAPKFH